MKKLLKRLRYLLNALWLIEGMVITTLVFSLSSGQSWWLPALYLPINSFALWRFEQLDQYLQQVPAPSEHKQV